MVLVRRKRMERRGNNTGGASLPPHCQGRFLRLTVITHSADDMEEVHQFTLHHAQTLRLNTIQPPCSARFGELKQPQI